jgi:uncharacterized protein (DUF433 family)
MTGAVADSAIGQGLYAVPEVARLTGVPAARVRRYVCGYSYKHAGERRASPPVFQSDYRTTAEGVALSFRDMIETRFIDAFREYGVNPHEIRRASRVAARRWHVAHPFSTRRFRTDGRQIFEEILKEEGDELIHLAREQRVFYKVIEPTLHGLVFEKEVVVRWYPLGEGEPVVIDPHRSLGKPVVSTSGVPTVLLAAAADAFPSLEAVADWYAVELREVKAAIRFEAQLVA